MASGLSVICLDLGGLALQVTAETGVKIRADSPEQVVKDMAQAMRKVGMNPGLRRRMGAAARSRVEAQYTWARKAERYYALYAQARNCRSGLANNLPI
jgi:glycosyltransferase involved in cell wall biosynthesis